MTQEKQIQADALALVLERARLELDRAAAHIRDPSIRPLRPGAALEDNNSTCNTGCMCGHPSELGIAERASG